MVLPGKSWRNYGIITTSWQNTQRSRQNSFVSFSLCSMTHRSVGDAFGHLRVSAILFHHSFNFAFLFVIVREDTVCVVEQNDHPRCQITLCCIGCEVFTVISSDKEPRRCILHGSQLLAAGVCVCVPVTSKILFLPKLYACVKLLDPHFFLSFIFYNKRIAIILLCYKRFV